MNRVILFNKPFDVAFFFNWTGNTSLLVFPSVN